jgi:hypothetical protein
LRRVGGWGKVGKERIGGGSAVVHSWFGAYSSVTYCSVGEGSVWKFMVLL